MVRKRKDANPLSFHSFPTSLVPLLCYDLGWEEKVRKHSLLLNDPPENPKESTKKVWTKRESKSKSCPSLPWALPRRPNPVNSPVPGYHQIVVLLVFIWINRIGFIPGKPRSFESSYHRLFSKDSGLEAFSHNPTHDSFSALTFQSTDLPIMWPNGSSRTKLDYCRGNFLLISFFWIFFINLVYSTS